MAITPNMSLTTWPNLADRFDYIELAENFDAIDAHDHTTGKGTPIPAGGLGLLSVGESNIQDNAISTDKIQPLAVEYEKLATGSVQTDTLGPNAVTEAKLAPTILADIQADIDAAMGQLEAIIPSTVQENWTTVNLSANGWSGPLRYYKDTTFRVWLEVGQEDWPAAGPDNKVMYTLPSGYRPQSSVVITSNQGVLVIGTDGTLTPKWSYNIPDNAFAWLDYNLSNYVASGSFRTDA